LPRQKKSQSKRTYSEIRLKLLKTLSKGQQSLNELSRNSKINWRTCSNHLIILIGLELVEEVFSSKYVRIFKITEKGKEELPNA